MIFLAVTSQPAKHFINALIIDRLPLGIEDAVAILLRVTYVFHLLHCWAVVNIAIGVSGDERRFVGRTLLDA